MKTSLLFLLSLLPGRALFADVAGITVIGPVILIPLAIAAVIIVAALVIERVLRKKKK